MKQSPSITALFPCYNDITTIPAMVALATMTLKRIAQDFEVIVVDDGSTDGSRELLAELSNLYPELRVIYHESNRGYGGVLQTGFAAACKECVFYTDGDAQYEVRELALLLDNLEPDVDIVQGIRRKRCDPLIRLILGWFYRSYVRYAFGLGIQDLTCDFRLIRRKVLQAITLHETTAVICLELIVKLRDTGARFVEIPVSHYYRSHGKSQVFGALSSLSLIRNIFRFSKNYRAAKRE